MSEAPVEPARDHDRHLLRGAAGLAGLGLGGPLALTASSTLAAGVDTSLPYGGQYLGCPSYGGGKANNGFWNRHSYRFVAERSGAIKNVRWENRTGSGYSTGNGGSVQISIQTDSGGYPSGQKLGYTGVYANAATLGLYPVYTFSAQPQLVYGTTYHLVFQQVAASQGMTSVNDLADWVAPPDGLSIFPLQKSTLASIRYQNNAWKVMPGQIPIYELTYADGTAKGQPMMGGGRPDQQPDRRRQHGPPELRHVRPVGHRLRHLFRPLPHRLGRPAHHPHHQQQQQGPLSDQRRRQPGELLLLRRHLAPALALRADQPHHLRRWRRSASCRRLRCSSSSAR